MFMVLQGLDDFGISCHINYATTNTQKIKWIWKYAIYFHNTSLMHFKATEIKIYSVQ